MKGRHLYIVSLCLLAVGAAAVGCTGDEPVVSSAAVDGGPALDSGNGVGDAAPETGGDDAGADAAPACPPTLPFRDSFEGRTALTGCWDALINNGGLAPTSKGDLALIPSTLNHAFHVALQPPDGGAGGALYLTRTFAQPVPAPARLSFKWLAEVFPIGGDGQSGLFAVEVFYRYKDGSGFDANASVTVAFGVNVKGINPYLGSDYMPAAALELNGLYESALELSMTQAKLRTKLTPVADRDLSLPMGTAFAITEIHIGVSNVGAITSPWSLYFDDVLLETL